MPRVNQGIFGFNAGILSVEALTRIDLERVPFALEEMTNFLPRVIGSKTIRPGTKYISSTRSDATGRNLPFVKNANETALIELTNSVMRVRVNDTLVTRVAVSTTITNGSFDTDLSGWTDDDDAGASSIWESGGFMRLTGTGSGYAKRYQLITVAGGDQNVLHALRIVIQRGPVRIRVGSTLDLDDYIAETTLRTGTHSLAITPTGNFYVTFLSSDAGLRRVSSIAIESAGVMEIATPWSSSDRVSYVQSGDVVFCASDGIKQRRIERRDMNSWSVVEYTPDDGPFRTANLTARTITPSAVTGNITLLASEPLFKSGHVGALWQLTSNGQTGAGTLAGEDQSTGTIRVTGADPPANARRFTVSITGTFTATITLQRSIGEPGSWTDVGTYTTPITDLTEDPYENEIVYYRLTIKPGDYTSGSAVASLIYSNSAQTGVVRITRYTDAMNVDAEVLSTLGKAEATTNWREGEWSDYRGYPGAVTLDDGRLVWGWKDRLFHSVSDAYDSYDQSIEGDAGPIIRSVAVGAADGIFWLKSLGRLFAGGPTQEVQIRSSSFDEPLTPTQWSVRRVSSRGSMDLDAVDVDDNVVFPQRDGTQVYEISYDPETQDYSSKALTRLNPEICSAGITGMAVQRQPNTRVWFVLEDGTCAVLTYERAERVVAWSKVETDGDVEDVSCLPGEDEDQVYLIVKRTINGSTKRYVEKLAKESECIGGSMSWVMDCAVSYSGASTTTITGLGHLIGKQVVVWSGGAASRDQSNMATVSGGGSITVPSAVTSATIGLPYTARSKSMKLAFGAGLGSPLLQKKRVDHLGVLLRRTAWKGIKFGRNYDKLNNLPKMRDSTGQELDANIVFDYYDEPSAGFNGEFSTDTRIHCEVLAPYPATVLGYVIGMVTNDKG